MNNNRFFSKNLKSNVVLINDFINNNNIILSIFFEKFVFDLMFDCKIYNIEKA